MEVVFLLSFFISNIIFILILSSISKRYREKKLKFLYIYLILVSVSYFILSIFSIFWYFNILSYNTEDFLFIYSLMILIQGLLLFRISIGIGNTKNYLLIYLLTILSFISPKFGFFYLFIILSFLLASIFFFFLWQLKNYNDLSIIGLIYSIFTSAGLLLNLFDIFNLVFISNILFLFLIENFLLNLERYNVNVNLKLNKPKKLSKRLGILRYFIFVFTISSFVFIGTMGMHEFGHYLVSNIYCYDTKIVYQNNIAYTETNCNNNNNNFLIFSGIILPIIISILLFLIGGNFLRDISFLIIGFNFILSIKDLIDLGLRENIILIFIIFGVIFLILGIMMLTRSITRIDIYKYFN
jgi:hypothetical protein